MFLNNSDLVNVASFGIRFFCLGFLLNVLKLLS